MGFPFILHSPHCPSCGATFRLNYPTLYHQMEDLIMIYLVSESEAEKTYEMFYGENALFDFRTEKYLAQISSLRRYRFLMQVKMTG